MDKMPSTSKAFNIGNTTFMIPFCSRKTRNFDVLGNPNPAKEAFPEEK